MQSLFGTSSFTMRSHQSICISHGISVLNHFGIDFSFYKHALARSLTSFLQNQHQL